METIYRNYKDAMLASREAQRELLLAEAEMAVIRRRICAAELDSRLPDLENRIIPDLKVRGFDADTYYFEMQMEYEHAMRTTHWEGLNREVNGQIVAELKRIANRG